MQLFIFKHINSRKYYGSTFCCFYKVLLSLAIIPILLITLSKPTHAQNEKTYSSFINGMYTSGHIAEHSEQISHATRGFTRGFDIIASNLIPIKSKMNDRQKLTYFDVSFQYINYPMDYLGETYGLSIGRSGSLFHLNKFDLRGQFMYGFGYSTKPYSNENNKNNAGSTPVGFHIHANLTGTYPIYKNWHALLAVSFTHLSNGAIEKPNLGYNVLSTSVGVSYFIKDKTINETYDYYKQSRKYYYHLIGSYFKNGSSSLNNEKYPSYNLHAQVERNLSLHHSILVGIDYNNNQKKAYPAKEKPADAGSNDANYMGLSLSGSWKYSIIDFNLGAGYYLIKPWHATKSNYFLVQFKVYALKNIYLIAGLRSHGFKAKAFEAGVGIKL